MIDGTSILDVAAQAPEEVAWQLAAAELGGTAAIAAAVFWLLYKWLRSAVDKHAEVLEKQVASADADRKELREAAAEDRKMLAGTIGTLATAVQKVEVAVVRMDEHTQAAIAGLRADLTRTDRELAGVKELVADHHERITSLEYGAGQSGVRRIPKAARD